MAKALPGQTLPSREQGQFRSIVKFYETKQYKKGVKTADGILKKFPEHGETLSMKGLVLNCMGEERKPEAYELVKLGLRHNMRSHVCWHVFGLLYRSDRNYGQAIKCYRNALRIDTENQQILRDLSSLQVQMRDDQGFKETRRMLLTLKPNSKNNWIAFAISQHLCGDMAQGIKILDAYLATEDKDQKVTYESSELLLYRNQVLEEAGQCESALAHLDAIGAKVVDKLSWKLSRARVLCRLSRFEEAAAGYLSLLRANPENYEYHCGLQCAKLKLSGGEAFAFRGCDTPANALAQLDDAQRETLDAAYAADAGSNGLLELQPRSIAARRIRLSFSTGAALRHRLDAYMRSALRRGVPSLAVDLKELYSTRGPTAGPHRRRTDAQIAAADPRAALIGELVDGYVTALRETGRLPASDAEGEGDGALEAPTVLLWALALLAHHHYRLGDFGRALELVNEAEEHTPTALDVIQLKAKVVKRCGDVAAAANVADYARRLDLQDRYVNNKATKFLLRAGRLKDAEERIGLFTRHEGDVETEQSLFDMQCSWYETEAGRAHFAKYFGNDGNDTLAATTVAEAASAGAGALAAAGAGAGADAKNIARALKKFIAVEKHFVDFNEDQFDFHGYCLRKVTVRAYVQMLRAQQTLRGHSLYVNAAVGAIRCYLTLFDRPVSAADSADEGPDLSKLSGAERKRAKAALRKAERERRKAEEKREAEAKAKAEAEEAAAGKDKDGADKKKKSKKDNKPTDDDPDGEKLAALPPLREAWRLACVLAAKSADEPLSHLLCFDVAVRRGKMLLAVRALNRARRACEAQLPCTSGLAELLPRVATFARRVQTLRAQADSGDAGGAAAEQPDAAKSDVPSEVTTTPPPPIVLEVLEAETAALLSGSGGSGGSGGDALLAHIESFAQEHAASLPHRCAAARALAAAFADADGSVLPEHRERVVSLLSSLDGTGVEVAACTRAHGLFALLVGTDAGAEAASAYKARCAEVFPLSTYFSGGSGVIVDDAPDASAPAAPES